MNSNKDFKPFIPANKTMPEFTGTSIVLGVLLAIVFGGANAYLGLRVGMASRPAPPGTPAPAPRCRPHSRRPRRRSHIFQNSPASRRRPVPGTP